MPHPSPRLAPLQRNYRSFLLFVYSTTVLCMYVFGVCTAMLFVKHNELADDAKAAGQPHKDVWGKVIGQVRQRAPSAAPSLDQPRRALAATPPSMQLTLRGCRPGRSAQSRLRGAAAALRQGLQALWPVCLSGS